MKRFVIALTVTFLITVCCSCGKTDEVKIIDLSRFDKTDIFTGPYFVAALEYDKKAQCVERLIGKINSLDEEEILLLPNDFKESVSVIIQSTLDDRLYMYIISASDDGICTFSGGLNEAGADEHYRFSFVWDDAQNTIAEINAYIIENQ